MGESGQISCEELQIIYMCPLSSRKGGIIPNAFSRAVHSDFFPQNKGEEETVSVQWRSLADITWSGGQGQHQQ